MGRHPVGGAIQRAGVFVTSVCVLYIVCPQVSLLSNRFVAESTGKCLVSNRGLCVFLEIKNYCIKILVSNGTGKSFLSGVCEIVFLHFT